MGLPPALIETPVPPALRGSREGLSHRAAAPWHWSEWTDPSHKSLSILTGFGRFSFLTLTLCGSLEPVEDSIWRKRLLGANLLCPSQSWGDRENHPLHLLGLSSALQVLLTARSFPLLHQMGPQRGQELLVSQLTGVRAWTWQPPSPCKLPSCIFQVTTARAEGKAFESGPAKQSRWDCAHFWVLERGGCCFSSVLSVAPCLSCPSLLDGEWSIVWQNQKQQQQKTMLCAVIGRGLREQQLWAADF